MTKRDSPP